MADLPDTLEPEGTEPHTDWSSRLADHMMWVLSRALLICFIAGLAYWGRVPFHRIVERDVLFEMEESEKERMMQEFKLVHNLSLSATKFESCFDESTKATLEYQESPTTESRASAETKVHFAMNALDRLHEEFGRRDFRLNEDFERDVRRLVDDGFRGLRFQTELLKQKAPSHAGTREITFGAHQGLVYKDVADICEYERSYIQLKRMAV